VLPVLAAGPVVHGVSTQCWRDSVSISDRVLPAAVGPKGGRWRKDLADHWVSMVKGAPVGHVISIVRCRVAGTTESRISADRTE
jgi:hypothetical protein